MPEKFVDTRHSRSDEQREVMRQIVEAGHCPFCPPNLKLWHNRPILREGEFWILTPSRWPYPHTALHLLAIAKTHVEKLSELPPEAGQDLFELFQWAEKEFDLPGGALAMGAIALRFGDTDYTGATVKHLHAQLIIPDIHAPDYEKLRLPIGRSSK